MVWNSARVSCLQRDWQFRFEPVIVLFHTLNEQFVFPGDKLRQFSATRLQDFSFYLYRARQRRTGSIELFASIRRGRFLATSEIFVSPLVNSRIFLKRDIKSRKLYNRLYRFLEINSINGFAIKLNSPSRISLAPVNDRYLSRIWTVQVLQQ